MAKDKPGVFAKTFAWVVLLMIGFGVVRCVHNTAPAPEVDDGGLGGAEYLCRQAIEKGLNDPGSAEFEPRLQWPAKQLENGNWRVIVQLRARNAFGALIYGEFLCETQVHDGLISVVKLKQTRP